MMLYDEKMRMAGSRHMITEERVRKDQLWWSFCEEGKWESKSDKVEANRGEDDTPATVEAERKSIPTQGPYKRTTGLKLQQRKKQVKGMRAVFKQILLCYKRRNTF